MHQASTLASGRVVGVVDSRALRRAELVCFLSDWAAAHGFSVLPMAPDDLAAGLNPAARLALGVLNLGAGSVTSEPQLGWLRALARSFPGTPAVVISDSEEREEVRAALRAGARSFIPTSTEPELACRILTFTMMNGAFFPPEALLGMNAGTAVPLRAPLPRPPSLISPVARLLTERQQAVLAQLQAGKSNRQIGDLLGVRETTVKEHVRHIMRKLGATNRTQAALGMAALPACTGTAVDGEDEGLGGTTPLTDAPP